MSPLTKELHDGSEVILAAIANLKSEFSCKLDGILWAVENVRKDVNECVKWVNQAEIRISIAEDSITSLQAKVQTLQNKNKGVEEKVLDLEARSRRIWASLICPKGVEGEEACTFLENWLPEALNLAPLRATLTLERAHWVGQKNTSNTAAPRSLIMKFLNYRDKMSVIRAAGVKQSWNRGLYQDTKIRKCVLILIHKTIPFHVTRVIRP